MILIKELSIPPQKKGPLSKGPFFLELNPEFLYAGPMKKWQWFQATLLALALVLIIYFIGQREEFIPNSPKKHVPVPSPYSTGRTKVAQAPPQIIKAPKLSKKKSIYASTQSGLPAIAIPTLQEVLEDCQKHGRFDPQLKERLPALIPYFLEKHHPLKKHPEIYFENIHLKIQGGGIERLRLMQVDGENGSYWKMIHYREDEDQFAHILPLPMGHQRSPSPKIIKSYLNRGEVIYHEVGLGLKTAEGLIALDIEDGIVTSLRLSGKEAYFECFLNAPEELDDWW